MYGAVRLTPLKRAMPTRPMDGKRLLPMVVRSLNGGRRQGWRRQVWPVVVGAARHAVRQGSSVAVAADAQAVACLAVHESAVDLAVCAAEPTTGLQSTPV